MNNSMVSVEFEEKKVDVNPLLRHQLQDLTDIIEAIQHIASSNYWKVLKDKVFDGILESLKKKLSNEKDQIEIYRLQGQIAWADKYADLDKLIEVYRKELQRVRSKLT